MAKVRFGILGCGRIARRMAGALAGSREAELAGCAARDVHRAEAFAREYPGCRAYAGYQELIESPDVDALYVATVHTLHGELAGRALEAGRPVLVEKPMVVDPEEGEALVRLAREKGVLLMEGFWTGTLPAVRRVKDWIREGRIGEPRLLRAAFCFASPVDPESRLWNPKLGGGALWDVGIYPARYAMGLLGDPLQVTARVSRGETGVDASVEAVLEYPGALASCMASICGYMDPDAVISGDGGWIRQAQFWGSRRAELYDNGGKLLEVFEDPQEEGFVHEVDHFARLVREGRLESDMVPLRDTLTFVKMAGKILDARGC